MSNTNKNILLVSANVYKVPYPVYPLSISYLQTYLHSHLNGFDVDVFDFNLKSLDEFENLIKLKRYKYIGISLRNVDDVNFYAKDNFVDWYQSIIRSIRNSIDTKIILGGPCVSIFPELIYERLKPDFAVKGEGETSLLKLIEALENQTDHSNIEGLIHKPNGNVLVNPRQSYTQNLDISFNSDLVDFYFDKSGMLNIQTKRGCPYGCIYCSYPVVEGKKVRTLDAKKVVEGLKELYFQRNINYVFFTDSVFNICDEYNEELANRIIESQIKINWGAYFSAHNFDRKRMELYKKSGLTHVEFGTDSLSDKQLENYKKHFRFADILKSSEICSDLGIFYAHFLILAGIGETEETLDETFENCKKIKHSIFFPFVGMRIYPDTELYEIAKQEGRFKQKEEVLNPIYYISDKVNLDTIQAKANATGQKWIFPDADHSEMLEKMRAKKRKGPLWEYLRY
ncbi:B12-binding domain-containing radical SAM protein [Tenuifilaceae bacterium CYCD]|nr:B12-binding domain-containing radical SAM protein [Tenuifilaceae bacterium CYCD]